MRMTETSPPATSNVFYHWNPRLKRKNKKEETDIFHWENNVAATWYSSHQPSRWIPGPYIPDTLLPHPHIHIEEEDTAEKQDHQEEHWLTQQWLVKCLLSCDCDTKFQKHSVSTKSPTRADLWSSQRGYC
jgi:hypothetical protein